MPRTPGTEYASIAKIVALVSVLVMMTSVLRAQVTVDQFPGSDIGAQINAAYAAGPSTGVHIRVSPGVYNYATPIVFGTASKPVFLECSPGVNNNQASNNSTTQLNYTPTTGTAMTINASMGSKVTGCSLPGAGSGNSTVGLLVRSSAPTIAARSLICLK